jgi:hypothetical protein
MMTNQVLLDPAATLSYPTSLYGWEAIRYCGEAFSYAVHPEFRAACDTNYSV